MIEPLTYNKYDHTVFKRSSCWKDVLKYEEETKEKSVELNKREEELKIRKQKLEQEEKLLNFGKVKLAYNLIEKNYDLLEISKILNCKLEKINK